MKRQPTEWESLPAIHQTEDERLELKNTKKTSFENGLEN